MLDEKLEYTQYSTYAKEEDDDEALPTFQVMRLKYATLLSKKDLSGIERPLTVVARHFFFEAGTPLPYGQGNTPSLPAEGMNDRIELSKTALKAWLGFLSEKEVPPEIPRTLVGWFPRYLAYGMFLPFYQRVYDILHLLIGGTEKALPEPKVATEMLLSLSQADLSGRKLKEYTEDLKQKLEQMKELLQVDTHQNLDQAQRTLFKNSLKQLCKVEPALLQVLEYHHTLENPLFLQNIFKTAKVSQKTNDYKSLCYEKLIANAICAGKLNTYYLLCKKDLFEGVYKKEKNFGNLTENDRDRLLKCTAVFLLGMQGCGVPHKAADLPLKEVAVTWPDISNWTITDDPDKFCLYKYKYAPSYDKELNSQGLKAFVEAALEKKDTTQSQPLLSKNLIEQNQSKLWIHPEWIKKYDIRIVQAAEPPLDLLSPDEVCYVDRGAGVPLEGLTGLEGQPSLICKVAQGGRGNP